MLRRLSLVGLVLKGVLCHAHDLWSRISRLCAAAAESM